MEDSKMTQRQWFLRYRGKTSGPFGLSQLKAMRSRGQLSAAHEVSEDRVAWVAAQSLGELFPQAPPAREPVKSAQRESADGVEASTGLALQAAPELNLQTGVMTSQPTVAAPGGPPAISHDGDWYYAKEGRQIGPMSLDLLKQMASCGQLQAHDLVWRQGMDSWRPAAHVFGANVPPAPGGAFPLAAAAPLPVSGLAVASMVLGILWLGGLGSLLAVIFGHTSLSQINGPNPTVSGRGFAMTGVILGWIGVVLVVVAAAISPSPL